MKVYGYIYLVRNKINGKVYIGQTTYPISVRWQGHKDLARSKQPRMSVCKAIKSYGEDAFTIVELHRAYSQQELDQMETRAIDAWDSRNREYGYNVREGGSKGRMSEESKAKLSASLKTYYSVPENRAKNSERQRGRIRSLESRKKQSSSLTGKAKSESHKQALRLEMQRRFKDDTYKENLRKRVAQSYVNNPKLRARRSADNLQRWNTPDKVAEREERQRLKRVKRDATAILRATPEAKAALKARHKLWALGPKNTKIGASGYRGVSFKKSRNIYVATVKLLGKRHYAGSSRLAEEAARLYNTKATELYGDKAILNEIPTSVVA